MALTSKADYYPFGMPMPNKQTTDENYRYSFQGQEKDPETGMEAFELRLWDGRLGRWLTVDPKGQYFSPYLGMGNNPISLTDPDGGSTEGGPGDPPPNKLNEVVIKVQKKDSSITVLDIANYFGGIKDHFNEGLNDRVRDVSNFLTDKVNDLNYWGETIKQFGNDLMNGRTAFYESDEYQKENWDRLTNMSVNDWAYTAGYNAPDIAVGTAVSRIRVSVSNPIKLLRGKGGKVNGISISRGEGYGAKQRFDIHPLSNKMNSRSTSKMTIPEFLDGKKLPHYHRGKGNNLRYHRPWEKAPDGKRKW